MKKLDILGVRVHIFPDGGIKIYAKNKAAADKIFEYMMEEGIFPLDIFKSNRKIEEWKLLLSMISSMAVF